MNAKNQHEYEECIAAAGELGHCLFRRETTGGYRVTAPGLPAMIAFGDTLDEARAGAHAEIADLIDEDARTRAWISAVQPEWW